MEYLKERHDSDLIEDIRNEINADENLKELIDRHTGIYMEIINNYIPNDNKIVNKKELIDDKSYNIYQAVLKYDQERGTKFPTFLGNETKWMCLNKYNKNKKHIHVSCEETQSNVIEALSTGDESSGRENQEIFNRAIQLCKVNPDKRVEKIFEMRNIIGERNKVMPWKKISEELNMSIQGCINIHNSTIDKIKIEINKDYVK